MFLSFLYEKCKRGHRLTPDNIRINNRKNGSRVEICRQCDTLIAKANKERTNKLPPETASTIISAYKEPLRTVSGGYGYMGALVYDESQELTQCHECGWFYRHLGKHVSQTHGIPSRDYKIKYGLMQKSSLYAPNQLGKQMEWYIEKTPEERQAIREHLKAYEFTTENQVDSALKHYSDHKALEYFNLKGRCPDQVIDKIIKLQAQLGKTPSAKDFSNVHGVSTLKASQYHFGSWANAVRIAGFTPNAQGKRYSREMCIQLLRDFQKTYGREPLYSDLDNVLPTSKTFRHYFGSWSNAKIVALGAINE